MADIEDIYSEVESENNESEDNESENNESVNDESANEESEEEEEIEESDVEEGVEGAEPLGVEGAEPLGVEGENPLGVEGAEPLGVEGENPLGVEGAEPLGVEGENPLVKTKNKNKSKKKKEKKKETIVVEKEESDDEDIEDDEYLQKFDMEMRDNYIHNFHPEARTHNYEEVKALTRVSRNGHGVIIDALHKTIPFLTKYEMTRVIGQRAKQIDAGAKTFVKVPLNVIDGYHIALLELEQKKLPFIVKRPFPNGGVEYWNISDLELL